ncbi:MAG: site-specific integrase, partial [Acidobacteria bacterium]
MGSIYKRKYKDKKNGETKESAVWWISYYRDGVKMRESAETDKLAKAKDLLKRREGDIAKGVPVSPRVNRVTFAELAADVENDYATNGRRTVEDLKRRFKLHILPVFGRRRAVSITTADIRAFIRQRQGDGKEDGATNAEINRELAALKRAFSLGIQSGKVVIKPYIPMLKENNVRKGFFERDQFLTLRSKLPAWLQALLTFAYITGWRIRSEVKKLQWRQVDFKIGRVVLDPGTTKNDEGRVFRFTAELREVLEAQWNEHEALKKVGIFCPFVFQKKGKPIGDFRKRWETACKAAGVPGRIIHDFRRTAVRNLVRAGVPERVAMQMTGHKTRSVFERYNIVSEGDLEAAAARLDAFFAGTAESV